MSATNESATTKAPGGLQGCAGLAKKPAPKKGARSGKCTSKTKLAKGYVCRHHRVVKKKKKK